jgi:hypothetical protein
VVVERRALAGAGRRELHRSLGVQAGHTSSYRSPVAVVYARRMRDPFVIWLPFMVALAMVAIGFLVAFSRRGKVSSARFDYKAVKLRIGGEVEAVYQRIRELSSMHPKYKLDDEDQQQHILVFSSNPSLFSWGFFYPVVVTPTAGGGCEVRVDIQSRFIQFGPVVSHNRQKCADAIEKMLAIPAARVVAR